MLVDLLRRVYPGHEAPFGQFPDGRLHGKYECCECGKPFSVFFLDGDGAEKVVGCPECRVMQIVRAPLGRYAWGTIRRAAS